MREVGTIAARRTARTISVKQLFSESLSLLRRLRSMYKLNWSASRWRRLMSLLAIDIREDFYSCLNAVCRVKARRDKLKELRRKYEKTEDDIKALQVRHGLNSHAIFIDVLAA